MADEQPSTGGFSRSRQPRRDGFHDTLHPETGERLLLSRVEASVSKASIPEWTDAFALQERLGAVSPTAWWPVERQGAEGDVAYAAFIPWKSTLSQDLAKGYRCNPAELVALAECLVDGLNQLHSAAQRPHGALRPECIVFPKSSGDAHDSLAPRLTGLLPLDETDPRDHGDRRRAGHLLYSAITGAETNFWGVPDFGLAWSDVSLPGKTGWKKFIEDLTTGNLDSESYEQIRLRIGKSQAGKLPIVPIVAGLLVMVAGVGGFLMFKGRGGGGGLVASNQPTSNVVVVKGPEKTNPVVPPVIDPGAGDPAWLVAVRADRELSQALGLPAAASRSRLQGAIETWWKDLPQPDPGAWLRLDFPAPPALVLDAQAAAILKAEAQRRRAYLGASGSLPRAQKDLAGEIDDWLGALKWGQKEVETLIHTRVILGASNVLKSRALVFSPGVDPSVEYPRALNGVTNVAQFNLGSFKGWAKGWTDLSADQKAEAAKNLREVWRNDLVAWADFEPPKLDGPEKAVAELRTRATKAGIGMTTVDPFLEQASRQFATFDLQTRLRRYRSREEAQKAVEDALRPSLAGASQAFGEAEKSVGDQKAREARLKKESELQALDDRLAQTANTASRTQGGVRKARADLRSNLDAEKARDAAKELSFTFPKAEAFYAQLEDAAWVEEARASVDLTSTDSLDMVRSALELKLRDKPAGGFVESRKLVGEFKSGEAKLAEDLKDLAKKQAEEILNQAKAADVIRAQTATATARTDVAGALRTLEEQLKSAPGRVTNQSILLRDELVQVRDWLDLPEFRFTESTWTPAKPPAAGGSGWETRYSQVPAKIRGFQDAKAEWDDAVKGIPEVNRFQDAAGFKALNARLSRPLLTGKPLFDPARRSLQEYQPLVQEGESLLKSTDTNALSAYITKVKAQTPPYFGILASALQGRLDQANKDAVAAAEQASANAAAAAAARVKQERLTVLTTSVATMAKGVGGVIVTVIQPGRFPAQRRVSRIKANMWKTELKRDRKEFVQLISELEPSPAISKLDKELDQLEKKLQEAIEFTE